jgi:hypothetical protein
MVVIHGCDTCRRSMGYGEHHQRYMNELFSAPLDPPIDDTLGYPLDTLVQDLQQKFSIQLWKCEDINMASIPYCID